MKVLSIFLILLVHFSLKASDSLYDLTIPDGSKVTDYHISVVDNYVDKLVAKSDLHSIKVTFKFSMSQGYIASIEFPLQKNRRMGFALSRWVDIHFDEWAISKSLKKSHIAEGKILSKPHDKHWATQWSFVDALLTINDTDIVFTVDQTLSIYRAKKIIRLLSQDKIIWKTPSKKINLQDISRVKNGNVLIITTPPAGFHGHRYEVKTINGQVHILSVSSWVS
jgi:hypothetical protein